MRHLSIIMSAAVLVLTASCADGPTPEYVRPDAPESSEVKAGANVGKDVLAAPSSFGFRDAAGEPFNIAWSLAYGPEPGYVDYTWHFEPVGQGVIYAAFQDAAPYAPSLCFEAQLLAPAYLVPDIAHPAIVTPDGKRAWQPGDYRGAVVRGAEGALYLIAENADAATPLLMHPQPGAPSHDAYEKITETTPPEATPGSWQKQITATYHFEGSEFALAGYVDFQAAVTARFDFDTHRYYVYDKVFNPPYNDGLGLRYNAEQGDNDIVITTLQIGPDAQGETHPLRVHLLIYLP